MERVLAVELLHLLAAEGTYGAQVSAQLDVSDVWHAYRDQKHDLFLPAGGTSQVCAKALHPSIPAVVVQLSALFNSLSALADGWNKACGACRGACLGC
jgi:hypothetical protein